jgi:hypothetical protein
MSRMASESPLITAFSRAKANHHRPTPDRPMAVFQRREVGESGSLMLMRESNNFCT